MSLSTIPLTVFVQDPASTFFYQSRVTAIRLHTIALFHNEDNQDGALVMMAVRASLRFVATGDFRIYRK